MKIVKRLLAYVKPYVFLLVISVVLSIIFAAANVYFLPLTEDIVRAIDKGNMSFYYNQIANLLGLVIIRISASKAQLYVMTIISTLIAIDIRTKLYEKLLYASQHFHGRRKLGDLITRMFNDSEQVKNGVLLIFKDLFPQLITFVSVLTYLVVMNWQLTLMTLMSIPIFIIIIPTMSNKLKQATKQVQAKFGNLTHISQETLSNIKLVQAYTMEKQEHTRLVDESMRFFDASKRGVKIKIKAEYVIELMQYTVMAAVIGYGGYLVTSDLINSGELMSFFTGLLLLIDPIVTLSKVYTKFQVTTVSAQRVFEVMDTPSVIFSKENAIKPEKIEGHVEFINTTFSYTEDSDEVLQNINLDVTPGQSIALVGLSGAGKTTLMNLIPRFYDATDGNILIDNTPIKDLDIHHLRSHIALVPQEDILFRGSILENISYGKENASEEEVIEAAKMANAWEFIENLPGKLRCQIGDRGQKLSGGQKQRISIARAILKDPKILLLDEATSALDTQSERLVQDALLKLMKNRTTFVIAHRLSTIVHADKIVVLDKGEIQEVGSHNDLLEQNGIYSKLYQLQFKNQEKV